MDSRNKLEGTPATTDTEIESFFSSAPPLKNSFDFSEKVEKFIKRNSVASGKFHFDSIIYVCYQTNKPSLISFLFRLLGFDPFFFFLNLNFVHYKQ